MADGVNDAPAQTVATVGIAFGQGSDVTAEAAGAVIFDSSLDRVDPLLHIGRRMRAIALQSAIGGMLLSSIGMLVAAVGRRFSAPLVSCRQTRESPFTTPNLRWLSRASCSVATGRSGRPRDD